METPRVDELHHRSGGGQPYDAMMDLARKLERENNRLSRMLEWLAENLEDTHIRGIDPTEYLMDEDDTWPMAWERALDDAISRSAEPSSGSEQ